MSANANNNILTEDDYQQLVFDKYIKEYFDYIGKYHDNIEKMMKSQKNQENIEE